MGDFFTSGWSNNYSSSFSNNDWTGLYSGPDPAVWTCNRPLSGIPGTGTHNGPDWSFNPLTHEYPCTYIAGDWNCGSSTPADGLWSPGVPTNESTDWWDPDRCDLFSTDPLVTECVNYSINDPYRPDWGLIGPGTNCQEWTDDTLNNCVDMTESGNLWQFQDTYDLDYGSSGSSLDTSYDFGTPASSSDISYDFGESSGGYFYESSYDFY